MVEMHKYNAIERISCLSFFHAQKIIKNLILYSKKNPKITEKLIYICIDSGNY